MTAQPINSAQKMLSAEGVMCTPACILMLERKEIWTNVIKGAKE